MDAGQLSFEQYVRDRTVSLSRIAYLLTGDHHLAEDLVQQTLLKMAGRWRHVVASGDPDPYVRKALYHEHVSWWRRARRRAEVAAPAVDRSMPDSTDPVAVAVAVQQALVRLAPRQRAALVLRYFEDLSETQTAEVLGCRVGTVKSQVRDGLARLRVLAPELADLLEVQS
ncbi:RNA polymerase subunit sigma-24 [Actinoplanes sp. NBRC 14428]|nr:RNA polymerase subunit sigma-24 [Actinoplanes sp. NBRC 14428]